MELSYALQSENVFNRNRMPVSVSSPLQGGVKCKLAWSRLGFDKFGSFCLSSQFRHICLKGLTSLEVFVCHLSFDIYI